MLQIDIFRADTLAVVLNKVLSLTAQYIWSLSLVLSAGAGVWKHRVVNKFAVGGAPAPDT